MQPTPLAFDIGPDVNAFRNPRTIDHDRDLTVVSVVCDKSQTSEKRVYTCSTNRLDDQLILTTEGKDIIADGRYIKPWRVMHQTLYCGGMEGCLRECGGIHPKCRKSCTFANKKPDLVYEHRCRMAVDFDVYSNDLNSRVITIRTLFHNRRKSNNLSITSCGSAYSPAIIIPRVLTDSMKDAILGSKGRSPNNAARKSTRYRYQFRRSLVQRFLAEVPEWIKALPQNGGKGNVEEPGNTMGYKDEEEEESGLEEERRDGRRKRLGRRGEEPRWLYKLRKSLFTSIL
ncbi:hypothetical protein BC829DRAFT_142042 [Chytridium lagenaria]|nr:hypothetical protein BC829DRAFT_142042 [Chytridium lagenaria]